MDQKSGSLFSHKSVHSALKSFNNDRELGRHPLASLKIVETQHRMMRRRDTPGSRGLSLRDVLRKAVEAFRPDAENPDYSEKRWRPYIILTEEFFKGQRAEYLKTRLNIEQRTYQLARSEAIDKLGDKLRQWEDDESRRELAGTEERQMPFLAPPKPPYRLVGRYNLLQKMKERLFAGDNITLYALSGLPGVGKTALAIELANDREIISYFQDGILWTGLGREPDILSLLGTWASALGISWSEIIKLNTVEDRAQEIHKVIGLHRMLLIIDDAWQLEAALAFRVGGPNCAHLLTTRLPDIARDFAEQEAIEVRELSDAAGLVLFEQLALEVVESEPEKAQTLVRAVGGLPLAIILMAKYARRKVQKRSPSLQATLDQLFNAEERLRLKYPQTPIESHPSLPIGTPLSLQASIEISEKALNEPTRHILWALSIFPPKPNTFPEEAALAVSAAPDEGLDTLKYYGLLENRDPGRYTLHQAVVDYLRAELTNKVVYERIVEFFVGFVEIYRRNYDRLILEIDNVFAVLQVAFEQRMHAALVQGVNAFSYFMITTGLYQQAETHLKRAEQAARFLGDIVGLAEILYNLGRIARFQGDLRQAEKYLKESLGLDREIEAPEKVSAALADLGWVSYDLGDYRQAQRYFQESLKLARQIRHTDRVSFALHGLGSVASKHGTYEQAEAFFKESLVLAREIGDPERIGGLLGNLGWVDIERGDYERAQEYFQEGLAIVRKVGHRERISFLLRGLGVMEEKRGNYAQAEVYWLEALALARKIEHQDRISELFESLGAVESIRGHFRRAEEHFREGLSLAHLVGHRERASSILANLSRMEIGRGNYVQAEQYLQEGLALARDIEYRRLISELLSGQGELHLGQEEYKLASATFHEALRVAKAIGSQEWVATALYGLARVALGQGNVAQTLRLSKESFDIFKAIGHRRAAELEKWLDELPALDSSSD